MYISKLEEKDSTFFFKHSLKKSFSKSFSFNLRIYLACSPSFESQWKNWRVQIVILKREIFVNRSWILRRQAWYATGNAPRARSADRYKFQWYDAIFRGPFLSSPFSSSFEQRKIPFRPIKIGSWTVRDRWEIERSTRQTSTRFSPLASALFFFFLFPFEEEGLEEKKRRTWQEEGIPTKEAQYINFRR